MSVTFRKAIWMCLLTTTLVVSVSASAQSETCIDGGGMWSTVTVTVAPVPVAATERELSLPPEVSVVLVREVPMAPSDVQWCVDPSDPRCAPDPAGAPSAHLLRAGELAQATVGISIPESPTRRVPYASDLRAPTTADLVHSIERPPHAA